MEESEADWFSCWSI